MIKDISIGRHVIGFNQPTYFIVDVAANHDGSLSRAKDLIHLAAESGADAAKFQNFQAGTIVSDYGFKSLAGQLSHQKKWPKSVFEVYEDASLPIEWTEELKNTCDVAGIDYFTAPYDLDLVPYLSKFSCAWKLGSGDITWLENIETLAKDGKPLLIATGAATSEDVRRAMDAARKHTDKIVLMQCNTNYTASLENFKYIALRVLTAYEREYPDVLLGLSDHTPGHSTVLGAVALGARVIEKHFTDDRGREGPDHAFSMGPKDWREMVDRTRELEAALGDEEKKVMKNEGETVVLQRRALCAKQPIAEGETLTRDKLISLRPCPEQGLPPYRIDELIGKNALREIPEGDCISLIDVG